MNKVSTCRNALLGKICLHIFLAQNYFLTNRKQSHLTMPVHDIKGGNKKLVRVLLFISRQVPRVGPDEVQERFQDQGGLVPAIELLLFKVTIMKYFTYYSCISIKTPFISI